MKFIVFIKKIIINIFKSEKKSDENMIPQEFRSHDYERKLALIVKSTEEVDYSDLKYVEITKLDTRKKNDLFSAYRLDFHTRDKLNLFKKKYQSIIL
ncbi:hypothetical protein N9354_00435 [Alphaproteobacteria bacterium]|nr:hypothetical protein [Alphaproteobacteria bacterium]MDB3905761.1 hypothetical protein [Alphaproteobacteria bacterium]